jgi:hypothetical protein
VIVALAVFSFVLAAGASDAQAAACPGGTPYANAVMGNTGLAAYWRLDDSTALTACDGLNMNPGTYASGVTVLQAGALAGDADTAARFNGSSGKVSIPSATSLNTADTFSIEAWVKRATTGTAQVIATKQGSAWTLLFNSSNQLVLQSNTTNIAVSTTALTDTTAWHHVVATKSGTAVKLYIDGKDVTPTKVTNATMANNTLAVLIGAGASSSFFNGTIDELALYKTILSPSQVTNHFLLSKQPCPVTSGSYATAVAQTTSLLGYWRLDDRSGTAACDSGGRYPGSYAGTVTLAQTGAIAGDSNAAVGFDGTSANVSVPALPALDVGDSLSVEAWVKRGSIGGTANQVIVAKQSQSWQLMFNPSNKLVLGQAGVGDIAASTTTVSDTTSWHYVAATKTGGAVHLYIDGSDVTGTVTNRTLVNNTQPLAIGQSGTSSYFKGSIDEVAVYGTALTASQISNHRSLAQPPSAPSALAATAASASQIDITWVDNSSNETGFVVERSTDSSFTAPQATTLPAGTTRWSDTGLSGSTSYWYRVKAVNGSASSAFSNSTTATTMQTPPTPPTGLEASAISDSRINLAWKDNSSNETGFVVERSTDASFTAPQATTLAADTTSYSDATVNAGTDYWYRAKAVNGGGGSQFVQTSSKLTTAAATSNAACDPDIAPWSNPPLKRRTNCVGHRPMRSRGYIDPKCLNSPPLAGEIYPSRTWCGQGVEAIAQARAIAPAPRDPSAIAMDRTHWEVATTNPGRADITYETAGALEVYEVKQVNNWTKINPGQQVANYVNALNSVHVDPAAEQGSLTSGLYRAWTDVFLAPDKSRATCTTASGEAWVFDAYFTWMVAPGVLAVYEQPVDCFDPVREAPPVTVPTPSTRPIPAAGEDVEQPNGGPPAGTVELPPAGTGRWPTPDSTRLQPPGVTTSPTNPVGIPNPSPTGDNGQSNTGQGLGDPHLVTFDGLGYDIQAVGEFQLAESDALGLNVQARMVPRGDKTSVIDRLAFELNGYTIELNGTGSVLLVDGAPASLPYGKMFDFGDGAFLLHNAGGYYTAVWPGEGERPELQFSLGDLTLSIPRDSDTDGLLGSDDGIASNDLVTGSGTQLPATASPAVIHGTFADSWRIANDDSLFTYGPGQSTGTFTDRTFPRSILKIGDLTDAALADATAHCRDAGVIDGPQFDDCVIDWGTTGDQAFLDAAATRVDPVTQGGARGANADGTVTEDFEAGVAPNFASPRYGSGAGTGTFAGPFSHDGRYVAYVPNAAPHLHATVALDVITLGSWTFLDNNAVTVTIDGKTAWTGNIASNAPSSTGMTSSGQPYAVYPIAVTVPHTGEQVNVGVSADLPVGATRAFAVDNVNVSLDLVPPQRFNVSLPASISNGVPAAGAGNLETSVSQDVYAFSTTTQDTLRIELSQCPQGWVNWRLVNADTGAEIKSLRDTCSGTLVKDLPAGNYQLVVYPWSLSGPGTYKLDIYEQPPPEHFDVALPATISDGAPAAGAGNLETQVSEDVYAFSTASQGDFRVEFWGCSPSLSSSLALTWKLLDGSGALVQAGNGCSPTATTVPDLPAGSYQLSVTAPGYVSTYKLRLAPRGVVPISLPASISDGVPVAGAGRLETTTVSEDAYSFSTTSTKSWRFEFSQCQPMLSWQLVNADTGALVKSVPNSCSGTLVSDVPAGNYELSVTAFSGTGTYKLDIYEQPPPQVFDVSLPATISDGVPAAGAGKLETPVSQDAYTFTTTERKAFRVEFWTCPTGTGSQVIPKWKLIDTGTGSTVTTGSGCAPTTVPDLPAASYRLEVTAPGQTGTYNLRLAPREVVPVTLPASISDGVPVAGAGRLDNFAAEDVYSFSTTSTKSWQFDFSQCQPTLQWQLVNADTGATVKSVANSCSGTAVSDLPAGNYQVIVSIGGGSVTGTYKLSIYEQPPPQLFDVTLPALISDGVPAAGAGRFETPVSEDRYTFSTPSTKAFRVEFSSCFSTAGGTLSFSWKLINTASGATVKIDSGCSARTLPDLPAGSYRIEVTPSFGDTGTYKLRLAQREIVPLTLPASISDGVPVAGAGRLDTFASENVYSFTTASAGDLQLTFSQCQARVQWRLVNAATGSEAASATNTCFPRLVSALPAGNYELYVTPWDGTGTYKLDVYAP